MKKYYSGLDIGSTTSKMIVLDEEKQVVHHGYTRHHTKIHQSIKKLLDEFHADGQNQSGEMEISITGSIGLGLAEKMEIPFIQEVIATSNCIRNQHPEVNALLDIGGEDSKLIFFENGKPPDMKMNGNCAGGTGAFIDQIAEILGISVTELDKLAQSYTKIYPIASRCGVFAKTDIQSLIARHVPINDIAASVFHAMAIQAINTLARGKKVSGNVLFSGGPFTFLPSLKNAFVQALHLDKSNIILTSFPHMIPAFGASLNAFKEGYPLAKFTEKLDKYRQTAISVTTCLQPLFTTEMSQKEWNSVRNIFKLPETNLDHYKGKKCYLGIDSGSTTTKIVITGEEKQLLFQFYANNHDKPLEAILTGDRKSVV
jgi:predicted CoA-substrate-specific enzyme activase